MNPGAPFQKLAFFVLQDADSIISDGIKNLIDEMTTKRHWFTSLPTYVEETSEDGGVVTRTAGGFIDMPSAVGGKISKEDDKKTLQDTEFIVFNLEQFSKNFGVDIDFELDGSFVGCIENGVRDQTLSEGFLGEWRRHLYKDD